MGSTSTWAVQPAPPAEFFQRMAQGYILTEAEMTKLRKDAEQAAKLEEYDPNFKRAAMKLRAELLQLPAAGKNSSRHDAAMDGLHCRGNVESRPCATALCPHLHLLPAPAPANASASNAKVCARISNFSAAAKAFAGVGYGHTRWSKCSRSCGGGFRVRS